jgi:hypothetical protein
MLQNVMDVGEGETGSYRETGVGCDVEGTEEVSIEFEDAIDIKDEVCIKVEDAIDIKNEISEAMTFPPINTEEEVRPWCGRGGGSSCF